MKGPSYRPPRDVLNIGLLLPRRGPIGMWAPSSEKCVQLAIAELNAVGGIDGRMAGYEIIDASRDPLLVAQETADYVGRGLVQAVVGMHTSDIRRAVSAKLNGAVPYIFTPMYEGGESSPGTYLTGSTPDCQLAPMIGWMRRECGVRKWYLIGNSYVYPYISNHWAKAFISEQGGSVVGESYIAMDDEDFSGAIAEINLAGADAVLVNLVGCSAVDFHRAFVAAGLSERVKRVCAVLEENILLAIGPDCTAGMFTTTSYFFGLPTFQAAEFERRYCAEFGRNAPVLNQLSITCYEAVRLLAELARSANSLDTVRMNSAELDAIDLGGPRGALTFRNRHLHAQMHFARVEGMSMVSVT